MDCSSDYIKMCETAVEIDHIGWKLDCRGELYAGPVSHKIFYGYKEEIETNYIWLPRQDQLQEMVGIEIISKYIKWTTIDTSIPFNRHLALMKWFDVLSKARNQYANTIMTFSGEQLWLAFYMHEKHNKLWDGEQWILTT